MPFYQKQGKIPPKRHIVFEQGNDKLYQEEVFGTAGFSGMASILYHGHPPTMVAEMGEPMSIKPEIAIEYNLKALSYSSDSASSASSAASGAQAMSWKAERCRPGNYQCRAVLIATTTKSRSSW